MTTFVQATTGIVDLYLESPSCTPISGLTTADVTVSLRKAGESSFTPLILVDAVAATAVIGSGVDGTVTLSVPGMSGNSYTVEVVVPTGTSPLSVVKVGSTVTVNLAVSSGVPVGAQNLVSLVAQAINNLGVEVTATASGTGASSLSIAEGPTTFVGGLDGDFTDQGAGVYSLRLGVADTDTVGALSIKVQGSSIKTKVESALVVAVAPTAATTSPEVTTTVVFGYLKTANGSPLAGASVAARILSQPTLVHPGFEGVSLGSDLLTTSSDADGFFTLTLVTGSTVDFFIPATSFRRTFVVPPSSTNVFDLP